MAQTSQSRPAYRFLIRAMEFTFLDNPRPTAMGILGGVVVSMLIQVFSPSLADITWMDIGEANIFYLMAAGVFIANLKRAITAWTLPPEIDALLSQIKNDREAGHLSKADEQVLYMRLIKACVEAAVTGRVLVPTISQEIQVTPGAPPE